MTLRVLVVDNHDLIRAGLATLVGTAPGMELVGDVADATQAVTSAAETRPDVVVMDLGMPEWDGIAAIRQIRSACGTGDGHRPRILVLTTSDVGERVYQALTEGASGFLLKDTPPARILGAIQTVAAGEMPISPRIAQSLVLAYGQRQRATLESRHLDGLTPREIEVLRFVGSGWDNAGIAGHLVVSESTVKTHVKRMMSKLGLRNRAQAVVIAYESGIVTPGSPATAADTPAGVRRNDLSGGRPPQS